MRRQRRTKVVATLGPASSDRVTISRLFAAGVIRIETYGRANRPDRRIVRAVWPRSNKV